ncbi:MAG TPA: glycosyltransferase, partial [Thermoanaerobaculia bacterium]|nr:glycosyltransferase [Thermoanaerobaculia bacterium]
HWKGLRERDAGPVSHGELAVEERCLAPHSSLYDARPPVLKGAVTTAGTRIELPVSPSPRVSILIPSAADSRFLTACLASLQRHLSPALPVEVVVVLDGAGAAAGDALREAAPNAIVATTAARLGLAGAGNLGRGLARGALLVLLHDDAEIEPGWLEALVATADARPDAGVVGSLVLDPDGSLQSAGMILWREGWTSPPWVGAPPSPASFEGVRAVDYCGTCSLLVRASIWDAMGGLDDTFFPAYYVDVDVAMSSRRLGRSVLLQPASRVRHHRGASGTPRFRGFIASRNRDAFLRKWDAELQAHEPQGNDGAGAVARAIARAQASAARLAESRGPLSGVQQGGAGPEALPVLERQSLEKDLALHRSYVKHLEGLVDMEEKRPLLNVMRRRLSRAARRLIRRVTPSRRG